MKTSLIIVGIDGSNTAAHALAWAAGEAVRKGVPLVIANATDTAAPAGRTSATAQKVREENRAFGATVLADAMASVALAYPGLATSTVLREQRPSDMLLELGQAEELLVVGTHGDGRLAGALLGSVSQRVAAHAHCPVVVVSEDGSAGFDRGRIVAGVSPSPRGREALRFAFEEASQRDATLVAVRAYGVFGRSAHAELYGPLLGFRDAEDKLLHDSVDSLRGDFPDVRVEARLLDQPVYDALPRAAQDADLLVVGCHHADTHWPSRLGPVASLLLHRSPCPIAIVGLSHALTSARS